MGYRSDVLIAFGAREEAELIALFAAAKLMPWYDGGRVSKWNPQGELGSYRYMKVTATLFTTYDDDEDGKRSVDQAEVPYHVAYASMESVKWYESYEDVQWHEKLLAMAGEHGMETLFIRIGEEDEDIVRNHEDGKHGIYCLPDHFGLQRSITQDVDSPIDLLTYLGKKENAHEPERQGAVTLAADQPVGSTQAGQAAVQENS